jgi:hypothetical protein
MNPAKSESIERFGRREERGVALGSHKITALAAAAFVLAAALPARATNTTVMGDIGDANKASGLIRHYTLHPETRTIEAVAAVPSEGVSDDVIRKVTIQTAHDMCADGRGAGWTLKLYLPNNESEPLVTCRFGTRH